MINKTEITALILCGGQGRRVLGFDKGLLTYHHQPLIATLLAIIEPQVGAVIISANRHLEQYRRFGWPVLPDTTPGYPGPLAGLLRGLEQASTPWLITVPCDTPLLPDNLVTRLAEVVARSENRSVAIVRDDKHIHHAHSLMATGLKDDLQQCFKAGERRLAAWLRRHDPVFVDFPDQPQAFLNLNNIEDFPELKISAVE